MPKNTVKTTWKKKTGPSKPLSSVKYDYKKPKGLSEPAHWIEPANPKTARADLIYFRDHYCPHAWEVIAVGRDGDYVKTISRCKNGCGAIDVHRRKG